MTGRFLIRFALVGLLTAATAVVLPAQGGGHGRGGGGGRDGESGGGDRGANGSALDQWITLTPEQRRKALDKLPPDRRQKMQQSEQNIRQLTPEERIKLEDRYEKFQALPAERQAGIRQAMKDFQKLPKGRQEKLRQEYETMGDMTDEERRAHTSSSDFRKKFNEREREMLEDLSAMPPM